MARELDKKAALAWVGHPYYDVVDNSTDFEAKVCRMIQVITRGTGVRGDKVDQEMRKMFGDAAVDEQVLGQKLSAKSRPSSSNGSGCSFSDQSNGHNNNADDDLLSASPKDSVADELPLSSLSHSSSDISTLSLLDNWDSFTELEFGSEPESLNLK